MPVFDEARYAQAETKLLQLQQLLELPAQDDDLEDRRYILIKDMQAWAIEHSDISGRHDAYMVVLEHTAREERAKALTLLLCLIKGVVSVVPVKDDYAHEIGASRVRGELRSKLLDLAREL